MKQREIITVINGPNLAKLGTREPGIYGSTTQQQLFDAINSYAEDRGFAAECLQFDIEGEIVSAINNAAADSCSIIINPAGYSHYSVAILDALNNFEKPKVEVHISQIFSRESYRSELVTAKGVDAVIAGAGTSGYLRAIDIIADMIQSTPIPD